MIRKLTKEQRDSLRNGDLGLIFSDILDDLDAADDVQTYLRERLEMAEALRLENWDRFQETVAKNIELEKKLAIAREALELIAAPLPEDYGWSTKKAREALTKLEGK